MIKKIQIPVIMNVHVHICDICGSQAPIRVCQVNTNLHLNDDDRLPDAFTSPSAGWSRIPRYSSDGYTEVDFCPKHPEAMSVMVAAEEDALSKLRKP